MAKFAITTKTGRSITIDAPNFQKAEQEAKRRFGTGCVVDLVGNACGKCQSDNEIVKNALAYAAARNGNYYDMKNSPIFVTRDDLSKSGCYSIDALLEEIPGSSASIVGGGWALFINREAYNSWIRDGKKVPSIKFKDTVFARNNRVVNAKLKVANAAPLSAHEASVLLSGKRKAVTQYAKVEPNTLYYRALGGIFAVPESDTMKAAIEAIGSRVLPYQVGGVVGNEVACNDKWIDQFHVIITKDKPDANLLQALKEKAAASKILHRNYSNKEARDAHNKAEDKAYEIAKRLGAKWIEQGAVLKVVMPGNDLYSFNAEK